mmetsp:Transcript_17891/g.34187  ORF Transcript_17891/g.34187 Transcript_17891/m.34187 type:complete len:373 (-) Transcript_17891:315-1433(-)
MAPASTKTTTHPRPICLEPVYPRFAYIDSVRYISDEIEQIHMEGTVIGCSGEDAPRVGGGHHLPSTSFVNIPHRKPSGRVMRGMVGEPKPEPMTPPGEVAGVSFAPLPDWVEADDFAPTNQRPPRRQTRVASGRHTMDVSEPRTFGQASDRTGTILKGGVLARPYRHNTSKLPPIQGCPPLPPSLLAEGVAIADYGSQKMGSSDILQCQAEDDSVPKSYRSQLGISSGKLESVAMFPFAVNAIDEHSWRYRPGVDLSSSICSSTGLHDGLDARRLSQNFPSRSSFGGGAGIGGHVRTNTYDSSLSLSLSVNSSGPLSKARSAEQTSVNSPAGPNIVANGPLWSSLERAVLVRQESSSLRAHEPSPAILSYGH